MPRFRYKALDADGDTVKGVEEALTINLVQMALLERDLHPLQVREKKSILQFEITRRRVPRKELMHFSRQMGVFIRAGIPVLDALETISAEMAGSVLKQVLLDIADALRAGDTFAGAASAHPEAFPQFYIGILRSAELTGNLDTVLEQLSDYLERDLEARRKIVSALVYPGIVFAMSVATVVILTAFVLPRFERFFHDLGAKLPLPTRILLDTSHFVRDSWFAFVILGLWLALLIGVGNRTDKGRRARDAVLLKLPVIGDLIRHAILERFCRILSSMVRAGVPLPEALAVTSDATNNAVFQAGLDHARDEMLHGEGLAQPLSDTGLFPSAARQMFRVGEDTGTLDDQLETAAMYFERELDYKLKRFTSLFEPAVILFMGVIVGFVAIALVSAMYGIFHQVNP